MRLIDVDKITDKEIAEYLGRVFASCTEDVRCLLDEQPTAFDADKVIEQIKDHAIEFETFGISSDYVELDHVIEIVRGGGTE